MMNGVLLATFASYERLKKVKRQHFITNKVQKFALKKSSCQLVVLARRRRRKCTECLRYVQ